MKFNSFLYFISDAFKSLKRNKTISFASMATVLATLFVFGAFLLT
ncbi:MAG: permease-like cell division protein FtsX, partial [Sarcina sp.]